MEVCHLGVLFLALLLLVQNEKKNRYNQDGAQTLQTTKANRTKIIQTMLLMVNVQTNANTVMTFCVAMNERYRICQLGKRSNVEKE